MPCEHFTIILTERKGLSITKTSILITQKYEIRYAQIKNAECYDYKVIPFSASLYTSIIFIILPMVPNWT